MRFLCLLALFAIFSNATEQPSLTLIFCKRQIIAVKILDAVGVKEFVKKIPSKTILKAVLGLYRLFIEKDVAEKKDLVSEVFFTPDSILNLLIRSRIFRDEFEQAAKQKDGYYDFWYEYLQENEAHYTKDLSKYSGGDFQFPQTFVDEVKKYENLERGINSPGVFNIVFYCASVLSWMFVYIPEDTLSQGSEGSAKDNYGYFFRDCSYTKILAFYNIFSYSFDHLSAQMIPTMAALFPQTSDFFNRNRTRIVSAVALIMTVGSYFFAQHFEFGLVAVFILIIYRIFNVLYKRKDVERFSKHQNASVCLIKCAFLVAFQAVMTPLLVFIVAPMLTQFADFLFRLYLIVIRKNDPRVVEMAMDMFYVNHPNGFFFLEALTYTSLYARWIVFLFFPNLPFRMVNYFSDKSWRSLINTLPTSKKKVQ